MSAALAVRRPMLLPQRGRQALLWLALLFASLALANYGKGLLPRWSLRYPDAWELPLMSWIRSFMDWLVTDATFGLFTFRELTRGLATLLDLPLEAALSLLSSGLLLGQGSDALQILPPLSWIAVIVAVGALGHYARDWRLALVVSGCFLYLAVFGQWESAMVTLASIAIAVPFGVAGGLLLGIAAHRWHALERVLVPCLDLMQTVPVFAYLVPILFLFGFGPVAAMIATIVYAMPPMVRVTLLALASVPPEIVDFGNMAGCTRRQMTWKVLVPAAMPSLMVGVNQVIMLSLNMVIIASMIGAGGLGYDVLSSLRRLAIGAGLEAGVAIVVLAIALDRLSQAFAERQPPSQGAKPERGPLPFPRTSLVIAVVVATGLLGQLWPALQSYPQAAVVSTGALWGSLVEWINVNFFDEIEALRTFLLLNFMVPLRVFLLSLPWAWVLLLLLLAGRQLGGWRLCLLVLALALFILTNGQWEKAMISLYLVGLSVVLAMLIGMPIGVLAAQRPRVGRLVAVVVDTLQTLPSFVYLIPVVMLFRVGEVSAMIAIVLYALAPAIRYTTHGVRQVMPELLEAGIASGCTSRQLFWKVRLPLAMPAVLLGLNQTIMLALSMLVITALVGTRDLGQEVYIALTKADTGRGIVAGVAVAAIAMIADRLIGAATERSKERLGLA